jgi:hypothetical protein
VADTRNPYQDTSVAVERSMQQVREGLRAAGARGIQIEDTWGETPRILIRFLWPMGDEGFEQVVKIRLEATPLPPEKGARGGWKVSPEQRERQAWRALAWYLKTMLEAATFGLMRFEEIFLAYVEDENGRTIGEVVIPQLEAGRLLLPKGGM